MLAASVRAPLPSPMEARLLAVAGEHLASLHGAVDRADPHASVSDRSRMLCAGLAVLGRACFRALAGPDPALAVIERAVGEASAMLALLTKIDDQVIDDRRFHQGPLVERNPIELDQRTRAYLAPTLRSILAAEPHDLAPRNLLAARLGQQLRRLASSRERLEHVLDTIAFGWEVQVRAVRVLSQDPARVDPAASRAVSADISGAWLLMVTMIGELPEPACRPLSAREQAAFYGWGLPIQAIDALADLDKDSADGLVASWPGVLLDRCEPGRARWRGAYREGDARSLYAGMIEHGIEAAIMPAPTELAELDRDLTELGEVPLWLAWIHRFLRQRWQVHPFGPGVRAESIDPLAARWSAWQPLREEVVPCSVR